MRQHFETEQWLPFPVEVVFAFFANPANLPPLMPPGLRARIDEVTLIPPPQRPEGAQVVRGVFAGDGTKLLITARAAPGLPMRVPWLALIEDFRWNEGFCDVQAKGPFAYWRHCHSVRPATREGQPGSVVRDQVEFELPLSPLSALGAPLGAAAMRAMFAYRQSQAKTLVATFAANVRPSS